MSKKLKSNTKTLYCRFKECENNPEIDKDEFFDHCETHHREFIRESSTKTMSSADAPITPSLISAAPTSPSSLSTPTSPSSSSSSPSSSSSSSSQSSSSSSSSSSTPSTSTNKRKPTTKITPTRRPTHDTITSHFFEFKISDFIDTISWAMKPSRWLLNCGDSCYWFILNVRDQQIDKGIPKDYIIHGDMYAVSEHDPSMEFTLKVGERAKTTAIYKIGQIKSYETFDSVEFTLSYGEIFDILPLSENCTLYLGKVMDSDDCWPMDKYDVEWNESNERKNLELINQFSCTICFDYLKADIIGCANTFKPHLYCQDCFEKLPKKICHCSSQFNYDNQEHWNETAKLLKFPDEQFSEKTVNRIFDDGSDEKEIEIIIPLSKLLTNNGHITIDLNDYLKKKEQ